MQTYTKKIDASLLEIRYDNDTENPRTWNNIGYFITCDRKMSSPDKNETIKNIVKDTGDYATSQAKHITAIKKRIKDETGEKVLAIYPIVKYEHGGVIWRIGTKSGFDYSNNGFYIITDRTLKEMPEKKSEWERIAKNELETYTRWANGDIYSFVLYDENGEVADSCGGFYDIEDIRESLPDEWKDEKLSEYLQ